MKIGQSAVRMKKEERRDSKNISRKPKPVGYTLLYKLRGQMFIKKKNTKTSKKGSLATRKQVEHA